MVNSRVLCSYENNVYMIATKKQIQRKETREEVDIRPRDRTTKRARQGNRARESNDSNSESSSERLKKGQ